MKWRLKLIQTKGMITKEVKYGDSGRIVTVITEDMGKISALTSKFKGGKGKYIPSLQLFSYSRLVLFKGSEKGLYHINEADIIEPFKEIREDLMKIVYASYFGDIANRVTVENETDKEFLRLLLNIFYALSKRDDLDKIKTVFEWKTATQEGYAPYLEDCSCGKSTAYLDLTKGVGLCKNCGEGLVGTVELNKDLIMAIQYICQADFSKMLSFDMPEGMLEYLNSVSEIYLQTQLDHKFKTLDYLKAMKIK